MNRQTPQVPSGFVGIHLAEAAILGDLTLIAEVVGWFVPFGQILQALAVVPLCVLSYRRGIRVTLLATLGVTILSFIVGSVTLALQTVVIGLVGISVGISLYKRSGKAKSALAVVVTAGLPLCIATIVFLNIFSALRHLAFQNVIVLWRPIKDLLVYLGYQRLAAVSNTGLNWIVVHWWFAFPVAEVLAVLLIGLFAAILSRYVLSFLSWPTVPKSPKPAELPDVPSQLIEPVPVRLDNVFYRYPNSVHYALHDLTVSIPKGGFVEVIGDNGSGKSTLIRILAGWEAIQGSIKRPGAVGLGKPGGTSMIFQRPESQVLGARVRDDLLWGLSPSLSLNESYVENILAKVGLAGMAQKETSSLSGGQLQRLAIASALIRGPKLLISDESTSMLDNQGRQQLLDLFKQLGKEGLCIVHATQTLQEAACADQLIALKYGCLIDSAAYLDDSLNTGLSTDLPPLSTTDTFSPNVPPPTNDILLRLQSVSYVYSPNSPWANTALNGIDLEISKGECVVINGANGSGKSTLAWLIAGLLVPTQGEATFCGRPLYQQVGSIGLAFQHSRLQLFRPTVGACVGRSLRLSKEQLQAALSTVGLDPKQFIGRKVSELSGGEQRKAALACVLVRQPRVVVLDEPFSALDAKSAAALFKTLLYLKNSLGVSIVIVSHDADWLDGLCDRVLTMADGQFVSSCVFKTPLASENAAPMITPSGDTGVSKNSPVPNNPGNKGFIRFFKTIAFRYKHKPPRPLEINLFRYVPKDSAVHRLDTKVKLLAVMLLTIAVVFYPTWISVSLLGVLLLIVWLSADLGKGVLPRLPGWIWGLLVIAGLISVVSGGKPYIHLYMLHLAGISIGLGGFLTWARFVVLGIELLFVAFLLGWTTPVADLPGAIQTLLFPVYQLRINRSKLFLQALVVCIALQVRCLPLLADEFRILYAAYRLDRSSPGLGVSNKKDTMVSRGKKDIKRDIMTSDDLIGLMATVLASALRRAEEMGDAMVARGV
ncbi:MAG: ATP-binding cassette domain-containing protein [Actinobacteria bacterium]|nr:ATP-binding cassette domain-containing protein [Actinomycetota bacterium]